MKLKKMVKKAVRFAKYACYDIMDEIRTRNKRRAERASLNVRYSRG